MLKRDDIEAIVFDMDGLVLDTEKTYRVAWREAGRTMRHDFPDAFLEALSGLSIEAVLKAIDRFCGSDFNAGEFNRLSAAYWWEHVAAHGIEVKQGFYALWDYIEQEGIPFCLATNSTLANAEECLKLARLENVFTTVIARDHVEHGKPAPDIFFQAASVLDVSISRCIVLEDSSAGIEAAFNAGALPVMVPSAWPVDTATHARCRLVLKDLAELPGMIRA
jgi:beta-phosphoglucomutase